MEDHFGVGLLLMWIDLLFTKIYA